MDDCDQIALVLAPNTRLAVSVMRVDWKWRQHDQLHFFDPVGRAVLIVTRAASLNGQAFGTPVYLAPGWYEDYQMHQHLRLGEDMGRFVVHDAITGHAR